MADESFTTIPQTVEPPAPEDLLRLEDTLTTTPLADAQAEEVIIGWSPAIDFAQRAFVPYTAGGPMRVRGTDAVSQWCEAALRTRRGENAACDPRFGVKMLWVDLIDGGPFDPSLAAMFEELARDALLLHPAISDVAEFEVVPIDDGAAAHAKFSVVLTGEPDDPLDLSFDLTEAG